jgi:hypothetical protein
VAHDRKPGAVKNSYEPSLFPRCKPGKRIEREGSGW